MITDPIESNRQIIACEKKLLAAFETKDLITLNELIHDDALFVLPNGIMASKDRVLENYRSGNTQMASITSSDQKINLIDSTAIVSINLELKGKHLDQEISSNFRYLRVWKLVNGNWKVISTSGVRLTE